MRTLLEQLTLHTSLIRFSMSSTTSMVWVFRLKSITILNFYITPSASSKNILTCDAWQSGLFSHEQYIHPVPFVVSSSRRKNSRSGSKSLSLQRWRELLSITLLIQVLGVGSVPQSLFAL